MKNIKFNKENISKIAKRGAAISLAVVMASSLSGCGKKDIILEDTILEGTVVATVDGEKEILKEFLPLTHEVSKKGDDKHYQNVITGEYLMTNSSCDNMAADLGRNKAQRYAEITDIESISNYLTKEEIEKANNDKLEDADIVSIVTRIKAIPNEDTNINSNKKQK